MPSAFFMTAMGEGLAVGLKLRMAAASRSGDVTTGSLKFAAQGNRVSGGSPAIRMVSREREAVCLLNTWKQTDGLTW